MAPEAKHKVVRLDDDGGEAGEILTAAELARVRQFFALMDKRDVGFDKLEQLLEDEEHIHQIVDGKKASLWIWTQLGAVAKWIGLVVGAILAWKTLVGGQKP